MSTHHDTTPPISIGDQTKVRLPLVMLLALCGVVATAAIAWTNQRGTSEEHTARLATHEERLKQLEANQADIAVMRNDVLWIRRALERERHTP